jgi:hypothetical protein
MTKQEAYQLQKFINARLRVLQDEGNIDEFNRVALLESMVNREIASLWHDEQTTITRLKWRIWYPLCRLITLLKPC